MNGNLILDADIEELGGFFILNINAGPRLRGI